MKPIRVTIDIYPDLIGSPEVIGELVQKQVVAEVEGRKRIIPKVQTPISWKPAKNLTNPDRLIAALCGKPIL